MENTVIDRREALRRAAWLMGGLLSAPTVAAILNGCKAEPALNWKPEFFYEDQARTLSILADIIIPPTDIPGAVQAGVPYFIEQVVKDCFTEEDQKVFLEGLNNFMTGSEKEFGKTFLKLSPEKQSEYTLMVHREAVEAEKNKTEGSKRPFILKCKELTLAGFLTSEPGATQVLRYVSVPGSYRGCIDLEEAGGKALAT